MRSVTLAFVAVALFAIGCDNAPKDQTVLARMITPPNATLKSMVKSPPKRVEVKENYGLATLEGRWHDVGRKKYMFTTAVVNSVHVVCGKLTCTEEIAAIYVKDLDGARIGLTDGEMTTITHEYRITEWSTEKIVAVEEMPVATLELRIFPREKTADRTYTEREDPSVFSRYILE
jgi:hypothetical protein